VNRSFVCILVFTLTLAAAVVLRLCVGESFGWPEKSIVFDLRIKRVILAAVVGVALAESGVALQALLRNPLAEPFILGLSSGAAVGVMAQGLLSYHLGRALGAPHLGATLGSLLSVTLVYLVAQRGGVIDPLGLLLVGVVVGTINGAIIMLLNYLVGPGGLRANLAQWMMGYLNEGASGRSILIVAAIASFGLAELVRRGPALDIASLPDVEAESLGVGLPILRIELFVLASALAAGAVVLAGPLAFVGLIAPHIARLANGPAHRPLAFNAALCGAALVLLADCAAVWIGARFDVGMMPIGIFTATVGGLAFLWMLRPQLGRAEW